MKKVLLAVSCIAFLWTGCKEKDPPIIFGTLATDSTYVLTTVPATDPHNVLVEEFTGQSCSNCPAAHTTLETLAGGANAGRVNIFGLYITDFSQTLPPAGAIYDFRSTTASSISSTIYGGVNAIPSGGIDRTKVTGQVLLYQSDWAAAIDAQKTIPDSLNLDVESSFVGGVATIKATVTYTKSLSTKQNLSIVIVEDSMVDLQEFPDNVHSGYIFTNVFRAMVTSAPSGDPILDSIGTKEAGRVYWRKYTYTPATTSPAINPAHCRVIAFVNNPGTTAGDYRVLQSKQCKLMGP